MTAWGAGALSQQPPAQAAPAAASPSRGASHAAADEAAGPVARLPGEPRHLLDDGGGLVALLRNGHVLRLEDGAMRSLARGWQGEGTVACAGDVFGIDRGGRIASASGARGPRVSLHAVALCLPDGDLLALDAHGTSLWRLHADLTVAARVELDALPDAEPVLLGDDLVALPTEPTFRYRHGVLGDEVEAGALVLLDVADLSERARWRADPPYVIEQRRVQPYAFGGRRGLLVTRASHDTGAGVVMLEYRGREADASLLPVAAGPSLGAADRWLNLFAARADRAYAVARPHHEGRLQRYRLRLETARLPVREHALAVTNHRIGSRALDLGLLLPRRVRDGPGVDRLLLPAPDLDTLRWVRCDRESCEVEAETRLQAPLAAPPVAVAERGARAVMVADVAGGLYRLRVPGEAPAGGREPVAGAVGGARGPVGGKARVSW